MYIYMYLREIWKKFNKIVGNINFVFGNSIAIFYSKLYSINSSERNFQKNLDSIFIFYKF